MITFVEEFTTRTKTNKKCRILLVVVTVTAMLSSALILFDQRPSLEIFYKQMTGAEDTVKHQVWVPDWVDVSDLQKLFDERNKRVREVCSRHKQEIDNLLKNSYKFPYTLSSDMRVLTATSSRLTVCLLPKAASQYWISLMKYLAVQEINRTDSSNAFFSGQSVNQFWRTEAQSDDAINHRTIAYFSRNPWHRFVSVYLQKASPQAPEKERRKFLNICSKYRYSIDQKILKFEQFLLCAISNMEEGIYNRHWEPVFTRCDICNHPYNTPIAIENMKVEAGYVLRSAGVKNAEEVMDVVRKQTIRDVEQKNMSSKYADFYNKLKDQSLINRFKTLFTIEFEMFGYPTSPYISLNITSGT